MLLIEIKFLQYGSPFLEIGKQYIAEEYVAGTFLIQDQHVVFPEEVKLIGKFKEHLNYRYIGKDAVSVVVFQFYDRCDYILSLEQFVELGCMDHIYIDNQIEECEVKEIIWGSMSEKQFNSLEAWEG
ncbi:hypothetical protein D3C87_1204230 [compost metagenome]